MVRMTHNNTMVDGVHSIRRSIDIPEFVEYFNNIMTALAYGAEEALTEDEKRQLFYYGVCQCGAIKENK